MAISEQWAELLTPGLRSIFFLTFSELSAASRIPMLFNELSSTKSAEYFLGIGGMGNWKKYQGAIEYDDPEQGFKTTLTPDEFAQGFKVERKLADDELYNIINARPRGLAMAANRTRETHAASVFNNAFSGSYTGGDSQPLCESAGHPYSPSNAATQTNEGSSPASYEAIVETRRLMREFTDDRGNIVAINPDTVVFPPELEETMNGILNTMNKVDVSDYHDNFPRRIGMKGLSWDYLTDADNWFMIDSRLAKLHLLWLDRIALEFALDPTSDFRLEARYRGYMRYAYGWSDWRWVYGHNVT